MDDDSWAQSTELDESRLGVNAISWAPVTAHGAGGAPMFATGSCDNVVRVWKQVFLIFLN